jgi:hypothetical protein
MYSGTLIDDLFARGGSAEFRHGGPNPKRGFARLANGLAAESLPVLQGNFRGRTVPAAVSSEPG